MYSVCVFRVCFSIDPVVALKKRREACLSKRRALVSGHLGLTLASRKHAALPHHREGP